MLYLLSVAGAYVFRLSYLGWFGPYFLAAVILIPLFVLALSLPSMLELKLSLSAPAFITRGEEGRLTLHFSNRRFLPVGRVRVILELENRFTGEHKTTKHSFLCVGTDTAELPLPTELCGTLICRIRQYECTDLRDMFSFKRRCDEKAICTVLPKPQPPEPSLDLDAVMNTTPKLRPKYGGGFSEDHDLRQYQPGDGSSSIHWKLSSKMDELIVREALERENDQIFLVLSRVGAEDRGLAVLYWLSLELCQQELPHFLVGGSLYPVGNEQECREALGTLLSLPMTEPCAFDAAMARCIFRIIDGEVRVQ